MGVITKFPESSQIILYIYYIYIYMCVCVNLILKAMVLRVTQFKKLPKWVLILLLDAIKLRKRFKIV